MRIAVGWADMRVAVQHDPREGLVGQQPDHLAVPGRLTLQQTGKSVEPRARIDPSCRVVRRVDDHDARAWRDRGLDRGQVEVEGSRHEVHRHRDTGRPADQRPIVEPAEARIDHLLAGFPHRRHGAGQGRILKQGDTEAVFRTPGHPYTAALPSAATRVADEPALAAK